MRRKKGAGLFRFIGKLISFLFLIYLLKLFVGDIVHVSNDNMQGTLEAGDRIVISKIHTGSRTPITPLEVPFSDWFADAPIFNDGILLRPFFLPKIYEPYYNQPIIFNKPVVDTLPVDRKEVATSRIVGMPGDTVNIQKTDVSVNGQFLIEPAGVQWPYEIKVLPKFKEKVIPQLGIEAYTQVDKNTYHSLMSKEQATILMNIKNVRFAKIKWHDVLSNDSLQLYGSKKWSLFNYGPIHIPRKGEEVPINAKTIDLYMPLLVHHENVLVEKEGDIIYINGREAEKYIFKQDYYFVLGDNRANTIDSRHFGPVPQSYIIGQPVMILFSYRPNRESFFASIQPDRSFTILQ